MVEQNYFSVDILSVLVLSMMNNTKQKKKTMTNITKLYLFETRLQNTEKR